MDRKFTTGAQCAKHLTMLLGVLNCVVLGRDNAGVVGSIVVRHVLQAASSKPAGHTLSAPNWTTVRRWAWGNSRAKVRFFAPLPHTRLVSA
jgi:hypothetical protein